MPTISSGSVLVTGANGYIAVWIVKTLLEQGYSVRGTVRSPSKGSHLKETFKEYGDRLEVVVVENMITVRVVYTNASEPRTENHSHHIAGRCI